MIVRAQVGYIDDRFGPLGLAGVVVLALTAILIISLVDFVDQMHKSNAPHASPPLPAHPGALLAPRHAAPSLRTAPFGAVQSS